MSDTVANPTTQPKDASPASRKRRALNGMLVYAMVFGVVDAFLPDYDPRMGVVARIPLIALTISWCYVDAGERDFVFGKLQRLLLIFFFVLGLPIYLLRTRGIRGVLSITLAFLYGIFVLFIEDAATIVTLEIGQLAGWWQYELP